VAMGKTVIVIDLNPLSRSAQQASITVVDELSRALSTMLSWKEDDERVPYDHKATLKDAHKAMLEGLNNA